MVLDVIVLDVIVLDVIKKNSHVEAIFLYLTFSTFQVPSYLDLVSSYHGGFIFIPAIFVFVVMFSFALSLSLKSFFILGYGLYEFSKMPRHT